MTKAELIEKLAQRFPKLLSKDTELAVRLILDEISDTLSRGDRVEIRGFGSFGVNYRNARIGRNPKSGEEVAIDGKHMPHFKPGKELRDRVVAAWQTQDVMK